MSSPVTHLPRIGLLTVRQRFPRSTPVDLPLAIRTGFAALGSRRCPPAGAPVAVAVGSRGIMRLPEIVEAVVEQVRSLGCRPFLVPAMGSHGGATAAGQAELLRGLGVEAERIGVAIHAGMETRVLGRTESGIEVPWSVEGGSAAGVVLINRVKPHTDFSGALGSGLVKMAVVGMGKHAGALVFHRAAARLGYEAALRAMARVVFARAPIWCGVGIIEDACHQLSRVEVVPAGETEAREEGMLREARAAMALLPVRDIDLLIVDQLGKDISGTGMDPNVIGRSIHGYSLGSPGPGAAGTPFIRRIWVRGLSPGSHGNATGIGLADVVSSRVVGAMDARATYTNALTALSLQGCKIPMHFGTDRECFEHLLHTLGDAPPGGPRIVRISNTLALETLQLSEAYEPEISSRPDLEVVQPGQAVEFDAEGTLL